MAQDSIKHYDNNPSGTKPFHIEGGKVESTAMRERCDFHNVGPAMISLCVLGLVLVLQSCAGKAAHDEALAAKRAVEFAETVFVQRDIEKGYRLLSDGARRYVPIEKFKETVTRMHPKGYPTSVTATEFEPMPGGENAIYIFLTGDGPGDRFDYTLTLEGSRTTDYRISTLERGTSAHLFMAHRKTPLKK